MISPGLEKLALDTVPNLITAAAGGLAGAAATLTTNYLQHRKVIKNEVTDLSSVTVTETGYIRDRKNGPRKPGASFSQDALDRLYYTQIIRNFDAVDLSQAYTQSHYKSIAKHIEAAMTECTDENPVVLSHVDMAIDAKEKDNQKRQSYKKAFTDPIVNYCSKTFNPNTTSYVLQDGASKRRSYEGEVCLIPILFYEPNAVKKQLRLLLITEADLLAIRDMDPARIRCENDTEGLGQQHIHFDRFRTLQTIANLYADPRSNVKTMLTACAFKTQAYTAPHGSQYLQRRAVAKRTAFIGAPG
jgi:hypothetical protein